MSVNKAIVVGNLGRDPEVRALPSGQSVASFSIATTARFTDRNGEPQQCTESLWNDRLRFAVFVDYAASRTNHRSAELQAKEPADEKQITIRWARCTRG
jgi:single stranded DNA-binding protein